MTTNKTLALDNILGPVQAADLQQDITRFVEVVVREFFSIYRSTTQPSISQLAATQIPQEPEIIEEKAVEQPKSAIPDYVSGALRRGFYLEIFTASDVAYFLNLPEALVIKNFKEMGIRPKIKALSSAVEGRSLTCRLASQIYESYYKQGKERQEIARSFDIDVMTVSEAILKKQLIAPRIVEGLRKLYGIPDLDKPYKISKI